jgi:N-acetylmuramoyl-L-alanine amidase
VPAILAVAICTAGCSHVPRGQNIEPGVDPDYVRRVSIHELAGSLGLQVGRSSSVSATLRNPANIVLVFADPDGAVHVNGQALPRRGGIVAADGILFVPAAYETSIRGRLRRVARRRDPDPPVAPIGPLGTVVIDPGHGGRDPGAHYPIQPGLPDIEEKWINLQVATRIATQLKTSGVKVFLTRSRDLYVDNSDRAALANRLNADLFLSNHANAVGNNDRTIRGYEVYVHPNASGQSLSAAKAVAARLDRIGVPRHGAVAYRKKNLLVLRETKGPAVLVEIGYMTNARELQRMASAAYQKRIAAAVAEGVIDFLKARRAP